MGGLNIPIGASLSGANNAATQTAALTNNGALVGIQQGSNDFKNGTEIAISIIRSGGATPGIVKILNGAGDPGTFAASNTTGTSFNSPDWSRGADAFRDYCSRVGLMVSGVRFETDNVANWSRSITMGDNMPNQTTKYKKWQLNKYRQATGNTYANTATVNDGTENFYIYSCFFMNMDDLALGSTFTIYLNVIGYDKLVSAQEVSY